MAKLSLKEQWVLVTGASSGIGKALCEVAASQGARLVLVARGGERLEQLAAELSVPCHVVATDLSTEDGRAQLYERVRSLDLQVDHVFNNAGFGLAGPFAELDLQGQSNMVELNCAALIQITHHFLNPMLERGYGGFLQVASVAGLAPVPFMATYGATKAFVVSFSNALQEELKGSGVHSTALCPGSVATGFQGRAGFEIGGLEKRSQLPPETVARVALKAYLKRKATVSPGFNNGVVAFASSCAPASFSALFSARLMRAAGRDKIAT